MSKTESILLLSTWALQFTLPVNCKRSLLPVSFSTDAKAFPSTAGSLGINHRGRTIFRCGLEGLHTDRKIDLSWPDLGSMSLLHRLVSPSTYSAVSQNADYGASISNRSADGTGPLIWAPMSQ